MADNNIKQNQGTTDRQPNLTMQHEQAKGSVGGSDSNRNSTGEFDKNRQEKSAIGGGENRSQTGEAGRARDEIKQGQGQAVGQSGNSPTGQSGNSPTGQSGQTNTNRETESSGSTNR